MTSSQAERELSHIQRLRSSIHGMCDHLRFLIESNVLQDQDLTSSMRFVNIELYRLDDQLASKMPMTIRRLRPLAELLSDVSKA